MMLLIENIVIIYSKYSVISIDKFTEIYFLILFLLRIVYFSTQYSIINPINENKMPRGATGA